MAVRDIFLDRYTLREVHSWFQHLPRESATVRLMGRRYAVDHDPTPTEDLPADAWSNMEYLMAQAVNKLESLMQVQLSPEHRSKNGYLKVPGSNKQRRGASAWMSGMMGTG